MATVIKRGDYQWQAKIRRKGFPIQSKTFETKAAADAWARKIEHEFDRDGGFISRAEAEGTTLAEALGRYLKEVTPKKKGSLQEEVRIKAWQRHPLGERFLSSIKGSDLAKYRDDRRAEKKAENTIRLELALLSHFFETARKEWGMESLQNPVKNIKLPSGAKQRDRRLRSDEESYLLNALDRGAQPIVRSIVELAIETAMRQSEILGLTWENIDIRRRVIFLADTKNGETRNVPLSTKALEVLWSIPCQDVDDILLADAIEKGGHPLTHAVGLLVRETGIQKSQVLELRWKDVDFRKKIVLAIKKNGGSHEIPLSETALDTLWAGTRTVDGEAIFSLSQDRLIRTFVRACVVGKKQYLRDCTDTHKKPDENFLDDIRFHDLRHEATTRLFELGLDMMEVSSISGHKSLSMLKRYTHLRAEDLALKLG